MPILSICLMGNMVCKLMAVLFSNYLILWIQTFVKTGHLKSNQEAKAIYINIMVISVMVSVLVFPVVGKLCDSVDPRKIVPIAFITRSITCYLFYKLDKPDSVQAYIVCISIVVAAVFENISNDSIYFKLLPKELRGVLNGVYSFCA